MTRMLSMLATRVAPAKSTTNLFAVHSQHSTHNPATPYSWGATLRLDLYLHQAEQAFRQAKKQPSRSPHFLRVSSGLHVLQFFLQATSNRRGNLEVVPHRVYQAERNHQLAAR